MRPKSSHEFSDLPRTSVTLCVDLVSFGNRNKQIKTNNSLLKEPWPLPLEPGCPQGIVIRNQCTSLIIFEKIIGRYGSLRIILKLAQRVM